MRLWAIAKQGDTTLYWCRRARCWVDAALTDEDRDIYDDAQKEQATLPPDGEWFEMRFGWARDAA
jgi:hypothetical protein